MMHRVIGTASVVAILTLAGTGGAAGEPSQSPARGPDQRPGSSAAAGSNPCAAVNPCAAKNPISAKDRAVRAPAWVGGAAQVGVDRFSNGPVSDR
jgi:hypothetical protein